MSSLVTQIMIPMVTVVVALQSAIVSTYSSVFTKMREPFFREMQPRYSFRSNKLDSGKWQ